MSRSFLLPACLLLIVFAFLAPRNLVEPPGLLDRFAPERVLAQDKTACDLKPLAAKLAAFKLAGDDKKDMEALLKIQGDISAANVACNGLTFSGKGNKVLSPFVLPKGLYKVTATTKGFFILDVQSVAGSDCKAGVKENLFNFFKGQGDDGSETSLNIENDCRIILTTSNATDTWKLTFESIQ